MKEEISKIIQQNITLIPLKEIGDNTADQILDLILNKIVIEKKENEPIVSFTQAYSDGKIDGWNNCIDQLEDIKNKLRE
jgi:hypothetical protein